MPTTTRLVAAALMAALGWFVAVLTVPYLPEGQPVGLFAPIAAVTGAFVGWLWTGRKIETGGGRPIGIGFAGSLLLLFWVLFIFSGYEMLRRATRVHYDGPVEAIQDVFAIGIDYMRDVGRPDVLGALALGGIVIGVISGWVARRFR